jgi:flagellar motor switch protein FliN/FliY
MPDDLFSRDDASQAGATTFADDTSLFPSIGDAPDVGAKRRDPTPMAASAARPDAPARLDLVMNIPVRLSVELGRADIPIREVVGIDRGAVIELDRSLGQPLDVRVNGVLIGHGEIVVVDEERLGLRFVDVVSPAERVTRLT